MGKWERELDLSGMKEQVDEMMERTPGAAFDKLESGKKGYQDNFRRICPPQDDEEYPWRIVPVHFGVGPNRRNLVCPRLAKIAPECPVCSYGFSLMESGDKKAGQSILPSWRVYLNVVKLNEDGELDDDQVYVLSLNQTQFKGSDESDEDEFLMAFFEQYGDLSHVKKGRNVNFKAKEVTRGDYVFNRFKIDVTDECEFPGDLDILEDMNDLGAITPLVDNEEMVKIFQGTTTALADPFEGEGVVLLEGQVEDEDAPQVASNGKKKGGFAKKQEEDEPIEGEVVKLGKGTVKKKGKAAVTRLHEKLNGGGEE